MDGTENTSSEVHGGTTQTETGTQGTSTSNDTGKLFSEEQTGLLNQIVTGHNKRLSSQFEKMIESKLSPLMEALGKLQTPEPNHATEPSKPEIKTEAEKELIRLRKEMDEMRSLTEAAKKEKEEAKSAYREEQLRNKVIQTLQKQNVVDPDQVYQLVRQNITHDPETDTISMRVVDPMLGFEDDMKLDKGIQTWLESNGKHFIKASGVSGSGVSSPGRGTGVSGGKYSLEQIQKMSATEMQKNYADIIKSLGEENIKAFFGNNG